MKKWSIFLVMALTLIFAFVFLTAGKATGGGSITVPEEADNTVSVSFVCGDGTSGSVSLQRGTALSSASGIPAPQEPDFAGWFVSGDKSMRIVDLDKLTVYESITLEAAYN